MQPLDNLTTAILLMLAGAAAIIDLRSRKIPNCLLLAGLIVGLPLSILNGGTEGLLVSVAGFGLGFVLLLPGYLMRFTGAGDLKLLATLGVYTGPGMLLQIFAAAALCGASLVCLLALWARLIRPKIGGASALQRYGVMLSLLMAGHRVYVPPAAGSVLSRRLPMAPVFAMGSVIVVFFLNDKSLTTLIQPYLAQLSEWL
ncbi:MAG: A24 family peptidase [Motiliproteus sp.]